MASTSILNWSKSLVLVGSAMIPHVLGLSKAWGGKHETPD